LTAVQAVAAICAAETDGAAIDSQTLYFRPKTPPTPGTYEFDVGTAGATTLIMQALWWPLLFADGVTTVTLTGGTQVPYSPPFHYLQQVAAPAFSRFGVQTALELLTWGWYPAGQGRIRATVTPLAQLQATRFETLPVERVDGIAAATNLPSHIPHRMARRAENELDAMGVGGTVRPIRERAPSTGAGLCLWTTQAGFSAIGRKGVPSDKVADSALADLRAFLDNQAAVDPHLADQLILPMALAHGTSSLTTGVLTQHALTNAALIQQWCAAEVRVFGRIGQPGTITITGIGWQRGAHGGAA
jgi:RNA 3'-terminal phosphate cyclase (ATP)